MRRMPDDRDEAEKEPMMPVPTQNPTSEARPASRRGTPFTSRVSPQTCAQLFRVVATAEAVSWVGLLTGMYVKYLTDAGDLGVRIFGPIHGGIFVAYLLVTFLVSRMFAWSRRTTLLGLACSVPPFATLAFEVWAQRTGRLSTTATATGSPDTRAPRRG